MNPFLEEDLIRFYKGDKEEDTHICPICLDNDEFTYKSWAKLRCHHCFHRHCIKIWMEKKTTCPVCVQPIFANNRAEDVDMKEFIINIQREEQQDEHEWRDRIIREYEQGKEREKQDKCTKMLKIAFVSSSIGLFVSSSIAFLYGNGRG